MAVEEPRRAMMQRASFFKKFGDQSSTHFLSDLVQIEILIELVLLSNKNLFTKKPMKPLMLQGESVCSDIRSRML